MKISIFLSLSLLLINVVLTPLAFSKDTQVKIENSSVKTNLSSVPVSGEDEENNNSIVIASGRPFGIRYAIGGAICQFVNDGNTEKFCTTYPTKFFVEAFEAMRSGSVDFAIVQSDWLSHAKNGTSRFSQDGKDDQLRSVAVLGGEKVIIVVSKSSDINSVRDLKNMSIAVGDDNTYRSIVANAVLDSAGLDFGDLKVASHVNQEDAIDGVCKGSLDGAFFVLPQPNSVIDMMTGQCNIKLISMSSKEISGVEKKLKGFYISNIPADTYWGQDNPIATVSLYTVLITKQDTLFENVKIVRERIISNIEKLSNFHPMMFEVSVDNIDISSPVPLYKGIK